MPALPCFKLESLPDSKVVRLPGGVAIEGIDLLAQLQPAITPLIPILNIVEAVIAVFNLAAGVPQAIIELDVAELFKLIEEAAKKMAKLAGLVPWLAIPLMILDMIDCIIIEIERLQAIILRLEQEVVRIDAARDRAQELGNPEGLLSILECAELNVDLELENQMSTFQALSKLFAILELLLSILGISAVVPDVATLSGVALDDAYDALEAFVEPLKFIRSLIPTG